MGRGKRKSTTTPKRANARWEERGFKVTTQGDLTLLAPPKVGKAEASLWPKEDRPYRSTLLDSSGRVVSIGFPKFFNWGEDPHDTAILEQALRLGHEVVWTEKVDGSLIIRSVVGDDVIFRTRASFDGGPHGKAAAALAIRRYPILFDPDFQADKSLLLEFVSPDFRIVISYPTDELFLVGAVSHKTLLQLEWADLSALAKSADLHLVDSHTLPREPKDLFAVVSEWKNREGIVARVGQTLVKLKGAEYLARHRLRFSLTAKSIRAICRTLDIHNLKEFEKYLISQGGDWELAIDARPFVEGFIDARHDALVRLGELESEALSKSKTYPSRKDFALKYAIQLPSAEKTAAFALLDGDRSRALLALEEAYLDVAFAKADAVDRALAETLASDEA